MTLKPGLTKIIFAKVDVNFQTITLTEFRYRFVFHFVITEHQRATNTPNKFQSNIQQVMREKRLI